MLTWHGLGLMQVTHVEMDNEVAKVKVAEMRVGRMNLQYQDKKTGDIKDEGATRPEVIMRQLCTRPGQVPQVSLLSQEAACPHHVTALLTSPCGFQLVHCACAYRNAYRSASVYASLLCTQASGTVNIIKKRT